MRGGNQDVVGGNARTFAGYLLGIIQQWTRQHAAIDHHDGNFLPAIVDNQGTGIDGTDHFRRLPAQHAAVHQHGKLLRRNIHQSGPDPQFRNHETRQCQPTPDKTRHRDATHLYFPR